MRKRNELSLEVYLNLLRSHKQTDLTISHLNQIISMHGFKKMFKPKSVQTDFYELLTDHTLNGVIHIVLLYLRKHDSNQVYLQIHLTEALDTIDLIAPSRSTLEESITPCGFISLEDAIADLDEIKWQECCVSSIQTLSSWKAHSYAQNSIPQRVDPPHLQPIIAGSGVDGSAAVASSSHRASGNLTKQAGKLMRKTKKSKKDLHLLDQVEFSG